MLYFETEKGCLIEFGDNVSQIVVEAYQRYLNGGDNSLFTGRSMLFEFEKENITLKMLSSTLGPIKMKVVWENIEIV